MTNTKLTHDLTARLVDSLVEDMLGLSDAELADEIRERGEEPAAVAARALAVFEKAVRAQGRRRLSAARAAVDADAARPRNVVRLDPGVARDRLDRLMRQYPETAKKLTLAARKGEGLSDADVLGLLANLEELGITDEGDQ
jgi:hypothetical protein